MKKPVNTEPFDAAIQRFVNESNDRAVDNGYEEYLMTESPAALAIDMADHDKNIATLVKEEFSGDEGGLIPYIKVWQQNHKCTA